MASPGTLLDPAAIAKGETLGLMARQIVEGYRVGEHRSPLHGFAIEFKQHREYSPGDDPRHLDWKILGRTDRYYIKQYEQDTNYVAHLLLDGSESMTYGSGALTKLQYAKVLAACLAHTILGQRDAVALDIFDTRIREHFARTDNPGKIHELMHRLSTFEADGATSLPWALDALAARLRARGIVIVISDLFDDEAAFQKALERLRFMGHEVIVFHVLDHEEIEFSLTGTVKFLGLEGAPEMQTSPQVIRKSYLAEFNAFRTRVRHVCERAGCHYILADTGVPLAEMLGEYLASRRNYRAR